MWTGLLLVEAVRMTEDLSQWRKIIHDAANLVPSRRVIEQNVSYSIIHAIAADKFFFVIQPVHKTTKDSHLCCTLCVVFISS